VDDSAKTQTLSRPEEAPESRDEVVEGPAEESTPASGLRRRLDRVPVRAWTVSAYAVYLLTAVFVTGRLWVNPADRVLSTNKTDHIQFQWFFAHAAWAVSHFKNPLLTDQINVPYVVNLMSNTSLLGMAIPLTPVTLLFGPQVSFALAVVLGLTLTAAAWYWVLSRHVVESRFAAWLGGAFFGFAPGMVSQAGGHPNLIAYFVLPFIIWRVLALREPGPLVRKGVILGLLITYQAFLNEEILFLTALGLFVFTAVWALQRPSEVKPALARFAGGLGIAALTAGILLAYPLYVQFQGPGTYRGLPFTLDRFVTDLASIWTFSSESLAGNAAAAQAVSISPTEENAFFGFPLLVLIAVIVFWLRRRPAVWALLATGAMFAALSTGPRVILFGHDTGVPGPLAILGKIPPFDLATPSRYALGLIPVVGILLTMGCDEAEKRAAEWKDTGFPVRTIWWAAVVAALLPIAPTPLPAVDRPVPKFITSGGWKPYVEGNRTLVSVPLAHNTNMEGMQWSAVTGIGFDMPGGYFLGPKSKTDKTAIWEAPTLTMSDRLKTAAYNGYVPFITEDDRKASLKDLKLWRAGVLVLQPPGTGKAAMKTENALKETTTKLVGFGPTWVDGVWIWDVRSLTR
jgi:hypothetical protein